MGKMKIFLSYSSKDYDFANSIKDGLENVGFEVFLAHTSIEPSLEWQEEIYTNLIGCDIFIPILTENFKGSLWADQEIGIAYAKDKKIISLFVDIAPYGFIGKWQGLRFKKDDSYRKIEINKLILHIKSKFPDEFKEVLFSSLKKISNFNSANAIFDLLSEYEPFSDYEINQIMGYSASNSNIKGGFKSQSYLKGWREKYKGKIDSNIINSFLNE